VGLLKDGLVAMGYFESRLLGWMPGGGGHFTAMRSSTEMATDFRSVATAGEPTSEVARSG
jgi:hypothetical protein